MLSRFRVLCLSTQGSISHVLEAISLLITKILYTRYRPSSGQRLQLKILHTSYIRVIKVFAGVSITVLSSPSLFYHCYILNTHHGSCPWMESSFSLLFIVGDTTYPCISREVPKSSNNSQHLSCICYMSCILLDALYIFSPYNSYRYVLFFTFYR